MKMWIGFSTTNLWISRLIRWFTKSKASHAWLAYESIELSSIIVLEAHYTFRAIPYDFFKRKNKIIKEIEIKNGYKPAMLITCAKFLGTDYDYTGIIGGIIVSIGRWLKKKWKNPFGNPYTQTCSEAVVRALQAGKYPNSDNLEPETITPQELMEFLCK